MEAAFSGLNNLALRAKIRDDDGIDQLHHFVTVAILAGFAAITGVVQYAGEPINCWNYGDYMWKHYQDHVNQFCWTHKLYRYPNKTDRTIMPYMLNPQGGPMPGQDRDLHTVTFFRWVTIMFAVQAFLFKLPHLLWAEYNTYSGSNIVKMVEMLQDVLFTKEEDRKEKIRQVALFVEQWLRIHRRTYLFLKSPFTSKWAKKTKAYCTLCVGDNLNNYLSNVYLMHKLLFLFNNAMQFFLLSVFLKLDFWQFGVETLTAYVDEQKLSTDRFPIVALCHFQTYDKRSSPSDSSPTATGKWVQCILTINMFLEKLFLVEWFWLLLLLLLTILNFIHWCMKILQTQTQLQFVQKYMKLIGVYDEPVPINNPKRTVSKFVVQYLRNDGVFMLRILAANTNEVAVAQLVEELWKRYVEFEEKMGIPEVHEMLVSPPPEGELAMTEFAEGADVLDSKPDPNETTKMV